MSKGTAGWWMGSMTPKQWQRVEQIFHVAMERASEDRGSFLDDACRGPDRRWEPRRMSRAYGDVINVPAANVLNGINDPRDMSEFVTRTWFGVRVPCARGHSVDRHLRDGQRRQDRAALAAGGDVTKMGPEVNPCV